MPPFPKKLGVIIFNLGGPVTLDDVKPFLLNLFRDPDILPVPSVLGLRGMLARLIVSLRLKKVKEHYAEIGGGSPLQRITNEQAAALEKWLCERTGCEVVVRTGMRYWHPFTKSVIDEFRAKGIRDVFLLPLYPQYSLATSGSSFKDWKILHNVIGGREFRVRSVRDYYIDEKYLASVSQAMDEGIARFTAPERSSLHILFSAHGLPQSILMKGDPYKRHIEATVEAVMKRRGNDHPHSLSYQSKVGPTKWIKPYTVDAIPQLARDGVKNLLIVPIAFVSDHIETLHELDIELREIGEKAGITHYAVTPGLNTMPVFIEALGELVMGKYGI
jgi:ferrochelatase